MKRRVAITGALGATGITFGALTIGAVSFLSRTPGVAPPAWLDWSTFAVLWTYVFATPALALGAIVIRGPKWARVVGVAALGAWVVVLALALVLPFL